MMFELEMAQIETLSCGVVILNDKGQVTDFNQAARSQIRACMQSSAKFAALIESIQQGSSQPPLRINHLLPIDPPVGQLDIYLGRGGGKHFSLVFLPRLPASPDFKPDTQSVSSFTLLGTDIRHEITQFKALLQQYSHSIDPEHKAIAQQCDRINRLLISLDMLSRLQDESDDLQSDRVAFPELVHTVLHEIPHRKFDVALVTNTPQANLQPGMVYGNKEWLKCMLLSLMEDLSESSPPHCKVEIKLTQSGHFMVMSATYVNAFTPKNTPQQGPAHDGEPICSFDLESDLRRQLCKQIAVIHGGDLKLYELENESQEPRRKLLDSITLILPTGLPTLARNQTACASCRFPKQAEVYAKDLAALMPPSPRGSGLTQEEMQYLTQLSTQRVPDKQIPQEPL
ncbi:MAG: hypothetical protein KKE95_12975 [Gammaproteobacteria bacterium]|jgi:hypothetical protein|nr:hypothetical protein [Gammaproteobacteria bacterium]